MSLYPGLAGLPGLVVRSLLGKDFILCQERRIERCSGVHMLSSLATWRCRFRWPPKHNWTRQKLEDGHAYFLCSRCLKVKDPGRSYELDPSVLFGSRRRRPR